MTGDPAADPEGRGTRYSPGQLARLLALPEPTAEQAAVIAAPLRPVAVIAGAGSGKSETMAARLVWLVANGLARPERRRDHRRLLRGRLGHPQQPRQLYRAVADRAH